MDTFDSFGFLIVSLFTQMYLKVVDKVRNQNFPKNRGEPLRPLSIIATVSRPHFCSSGVGKPSTSFNVFDSRKYKIHVATWGKNRRQCEELLQRSL
jgi:hypothetical protein